MGTKSVNSEVQQQTNQQTNIERNKSSVAHRTLWYCTYHVAGTARLPRIAFPVAGCDIAPILRAWMENPDDSTEPFQGSSAHTAIAAYLSHHYSNLLSPNLERNYFLSLGRRIRIPNLNERTCEHDYSLVNSTPSPPSACATVSHPKSPATDGTFVLSSVLPSPSIVPPLLKCSRLKEEGAFNGSTASTSMADS